MINDKNILTKKKRRIDVEQVVDPESRQDQKLLHRLRHALWYLEGKKKIKNTHERDVNKQMLRLLYTVAAIVHQAENEILVYFPVT